MMDYEMFKNVVKENFLSYMPEKYQEMEVRIVSVEGVNRRLDGVSLCQENRKGKPSPIIYLKNMYDNYLTRWNLQETLRNAAAEMDRAFMQVPQDLSLNMPAVKDNIIYQLVNTIQNENMLKNMPHREFEDLSVIYRWVINAGDKKLESTAIHNELAKELGMDEEQLYRAASENTKRILPPVVKCMNDVIREIYLHDGIPPEIVDAMIDETPPDWTMWIITNKYEMDGAASMLYEDELHKLSVQLGTNLFVMPSSIHEVIAMSAGDQNPGELAEMVSKINMWQVALEERLSNQVYYYDKDLRKLSLATNTQNKRLDGIVAEQKCVYEAKQFR